MKNNLIPRLKPYTVLWSANSSPKASHWKIAAFVYGMGSLSAVKVFTGLWQFNYQKYIILNFNESSFTIWNGLDGWDEDILDFYIWEGIWKEKEYSFFKNPFNKKLKRKDRFIRIL